MRSVSFIAICAVMSSMALPAYSQAPDANTKAILDALSGINSRLDGMQGQIDDLKNAPPAPAPSSNANPSAASKAATAEPDTAAATPPGMVAQPGWLVSAYPLTNGSFSSEPLVIFPFRLLPIVMEEGNSQSNTTNRFAYRGEAKMNVFSEGKYNFNVLFSGSDACMGDLKVNDEVVVNYGDSDSKTKFRRKTVSPGYADLPIGSYDVSFYIACDRTNPGTSLDIQVRGPNEMRPRPFKENEIFYLAPVDASGSPAQESPSAGETRSLHTGMNVRASASVNASIAAKLAAGDSVEVLTLSSDQQWAEVAVNGRKLGFVKVTALNANSQ